MHESPTFQSRIKGAVYGLAYGDAWGYPNEFQNFSQLSHLERKFPTDALISDDTQMSLYVIAALVADLNDRDSEIKQLARTKQIDSLDEVRVKIAEYLLHWLHDPDNNRAPGNTCMNALFRLDSQPVITGLEGTDGWSKGNGANIRCPWLGLLPLEPGLVALLAATQASVTHNNPIALGAAAVTSRVVQALVSGQVDVDGLVDFLIEETERLTGDRWTHLAPPEYAEGLAQLSAYLRTNREAADKYLDNHPEDACALLGEGWVAEEALLLAATFTEAYAATDPERALAEASYTGGDSDSIAAITGAFVGAAGGYHAFDGQWEPALEDRYRIDLSQTVHRLQELNGFDEDF